MRLKTLISILLLLALIVTVPACDQEGPAERAGEKIDEAVEEAGDKVDDAGEAIKDTAEEAKENMEEATK